MRPKALRASDGSALPKARIKVQPGMTPVHLCAALRYDSLLAYLMSAGGDPTVTDISGRTPVFSAILQYPYPRSDGSHEERRDVTTRCIEALLAWGVNIDAVDVRGLTALMYACLRVDLAAVEALLKCGAQVGKPGVQTRGTTDGLALFGSRDDHREPRGAVSRGRCSPAHAGALGGKRPACSRSDRHEGKESSARALLLCRKASSAAGTPPHLRRIPHLGSARADPACRSRQTARNAPCDAVVEVTREVALKLVSAGAAVNEPDAAGATALKLASVLGISSEVEERAAEAQKERRRAKRKEFFSQFNFRRSSGEEGTEGASQQGGSDAASPATSKKSPGYRKQSKEAQEAIDAANREKLLKNGSPSKPGFAGWFTGPAKGGETQDRGEARTAERATSQVASTLQEAGQQLQERGEKLDELSQKTHDLNNAASQFEDLARQLRKQNEQQQSWGFW
eukprot:scaffold3581_cov252-Pinguiococcus_pyrenoidosus.AAC.16